jgi:hypothetical protein
MSSLAFILSAAVATAVAAPRAVQPIAKPLASAAHDACGPQIDPEFTHYVATAPSVDGRNPLFRLASSPDNADAIAQPWRWRPNVCMRALRRTDFEH